MRGAAVAAALIASLGATAAQADVFTVTFRDTSNALFDTRQIDTSTLAQDFITYTDGTYSFYNTTASTFLIRAPVNLTFYNGRSYDYLGQQLYADRPGGGVTLVPGTYTLLPYTGTGGTGSTLNIAAGGPGAPAPEVGVGVLSALAAGIALLLTRRRRAGSSPVAA